MKKEELIALGLSEEHANKVLELNKSQLEGFIPKHRFDEVNTAKSNLETQLKDAKKTIEDLSKFEGDNKTLKEKLEKIQKDLDDNQAKYNKDLEDLAKRNITMMALMNAPKKPYDANLVCGLLDLSKIEIDEGHTKIVKGFDEQYEALTKDKAFLFSVGKGNPAPGGNPPPDGDPPPNTSLADFGKRLAAQKLKSMGIKKEEEK